MLADPLEKKSSRVWGTERRKSDGYIMVYRPDHPRANKAGEVPQHTLVLEDKLGRYLAVTEVAHHINHKRDDNRPENLRLMTAREHYMMHIWEAVAARRQKAAKRRKKVKPPKPRKRDPYPPWTETDNAYIREHWMDADAVIAEHLGRTKAAVRTHRMRMGVVCKPGKRGSPWLPQQEQYVRDMWGFRTVPEIAAYLDRTPTAVRLKAKRLGLRDQMSAGDMMTTTAVANLLGIDYHACERWVMQCGLGGHALTRGEGDQTVMVIYRSNLMRWLEEHQDLWDSRRLAVGALWPEEPHWLLAKRAADAALPVRRFAKWTPEEDEKLLSLLARGNMSYRQLGEAMGRSDRSIVQRVRRIGAGGLRQWKKGDVDPQ